MHEPEHVPVMQFDGNHITIKIDHGGLIISRRNAPWHESSVLSLLPEEAADLLLLLSMSQHALAPLQVQISMGFQPGGPDDG